MKINNNNNNIGIWMNHSIANLINLNSKIVTLLYPNLRQKQRKKLYFEAKLLCIIKDSK